jgi:hypothetical protein
MESNGEGGLPDHVGRSGPKLLLPQQTLTYIRIAEDKNPKT